MKQNAGEDVVEHYNQHDGINHGLGDGASNAPRTAARDETLMTGNDPDDPRETKTLEHTVGDIFDLHHVLHGREE